MFSLPQDWLWCETWCSDASLSTAKTIDLCNNPLTKEPKLERAKRILPEWVSLDQEASDCRDRFEKGKIGKTDKKSDDKKSNDKKSDDKKSDDKKSDDNHGKHDEL